MLLAALILSVPAAAQDSGGDAQAPPPEMPVWSMSIETYWTDPPDADGYLSAIFAADRDALHLEARWAYEDRDTASVFAGWSLPWEGPVHGSLTPMIGIAGGQSDGIVPALSLEVGWKSLLLTSDAEYLIATSDDTDDFFYDWSELTWSPTERFTVGLVGQRTNTYDQELSVDRGFLVGVGLGEAWVTAYLFNPDQDDPYMVFALGAGL